MDPQRIFETGLLYHHYANTAYPLTPGSFKDFRVTGKAEREALLEEQWAGTGEASLYVHVPFCQVRCRFCEYAVLEGADAERRDDYLALLRREMERYAPLLAGRRITGYDLGGGTPTRLSVDQLKRLTDDLTGLFSFDPATVCSVETTPVIAAREPEKIRALKDLGYGRISMGIQTVSEQLLNDLGREGTTHVYGQAAAHIRGAGFTRFNVDLMYGFLHQSDEDFASTLRYAMDLGPDYITLYRNRYKGTKIESEAGGVSLYKVIKQYRLAWKLLNEGGWRGNPGKNTFSRVAGDYGTSDYLTNRVIRGTDYLGMGLGAQSFAGNYLAYNAGAATKTLKPWAEAVDRGDFPLQDIYRLDRDEAVAKMVSVAFYFGFVDLAAFRERFVLGFRERFGAETAFVEAEGLMEEREGLLMLTERGADYINGIIPLFFSPRAQEELVGLQAKQRHSPDDEASFLKAYRIADFPRPSVAVDLVVLSSDGQVLLVRRAEHPFMNRWALPGGFVRPDETVEAAALRELAEECGIEVGPEAVLEALGVFSAPGRDPRGWVMSCAFRWRAGRAAADLPGRFGEDAMAVRWVPLAEVEVDAGAGSGAGKAAGAGREALAFDHGDILARALEGRKTEV